MSRIRYIQTVKQVQFHPKVREVIRSFPDQVKASLGRALYLLQIGQVLSAPLSKSMPAVGSGVSELRLKDAIGIYRVFYITKISDKILVFHAFKKKTQKTPTLEIELARKRLTEVLSG